MVLQLDKIPEGVVTINDGQEPKENGGETTESGTVNEIVSDHSTKIICIHLSSSVIINDH